ncbi:MAG: hypothetical protein ABIB71_02435, partial [Candidatus Woesearchaeota archaeon]
LVLNGFLNNKEMGNISEAQGIIFSLKNDTLNISVPEGIKPGSIVVSIGDNETSFVPGEKPVKEILDYNDFKELEESFVQRVNDSNYTFSERMYVTVPEEGSTTIKAGGVSYNFIFRDAIDYSKINKNDTFSVPFLDSDFAIVEVDMEKSTAYMWSGGSIYLAKDGYEFEEGWKWSVSLLPRLQMGIKNTESFALDEECLQLPRSFAKLCYESESANYSSASIIAEAYDGRASIKASGEIAVGNWRAVSAYAVGEEVAVNGTIEVNETVEEPSANESSTLVNTSEGSEPVPVENEGEERANFSEEMAEPPKSRQDIALDSVTFGLQVFLGLLVFVLAIYSRIKLSQK